MARPGPPLGAAGSSAPETVSSSYGSEESASLVPSRPPRQVPFLTPPNDRRTMMFAASPPQNTTAAVPAWVPDARVSHTQTVARVFLGERPKAEGGHGVCVHVGAELRAAVGVLITGRRRLSLSLPPPLFLYPSRALSLSPSLSLSLSQSLPLSLSYLCGGDKGRRLFCVFCVLVKMAPQNGVVPDPALV